MENLMFVMYYIKIHKIYMQTAIPHSVLGASLTQDHAEQSTKPHWAQVLIPEVSLFTANFDFTKSLGQAQTSFMRNGMLQKVSKHHFPHTLCICLYIFIKVIFTHCVFVFQT